jgi:single-strand selective monofunctional uracil DNA glycosylase
MPDRPEKLKETYALLSAAVGGLSFGPPVTHVYNPLEYAWAPVAQYLELAGSGRKKAMFLGMNPGPFGMAQTGVPFGTVSLVRDWMGIGGRVEKPPGEHPKRPVLGFDCTREEISGQRFWGWVRDRFVTPERFFAKFFVANYCPLVFMEQSGRNRTPDKLAAAERQELFRHCDAALLAVVRVLQPQAVIGVGKFAEDRAKAALAGTGIRTGRLLHPSPASPAANRGWVERAEQQLAGMGLDP